MQLIMNKRLSKYAHSHEQYTVTELDSKDFSSRTTNKDGRVVWLVVDPPPYAGMMSHAPNSHVVSHSLPCVSSCQPVWGPGLFGLFRLVLCYHADYLCLYWKLCLISNWERTHSVVYTEDKHWRRSVILPHHRCVSACCSLRSSFEGIIFTFHHFPI